MIFMLWRKPVTLASTGPRFRAPHSRSSPAIPAQSSPARSPNRGAPLGAIWGAAPHAFRRNSGISESSLVKKIFFGRKKKFSAQKFFYYTTHNFLSAYPISQIFFHGQTSYYARAERKNPALVVCFYCCKKEKISREKNFFRPEIFSRRKDFSRRPEIFFAPYLAAQPWKRHMSTTS